MLLTLFSGRAGTDAISAWRTPSGIRRAAPGSTLSVDLESFTNLTVEGGIDRVEFSVVENGGAPTVVTVSAPSLRHPNFSDQNSYLPGVSSGMAPFWGYGTTLDCDTLAAGTVVVTAVAYSSAGWRTEIPGSVTLYNDTDGIDRRPSQRQIFCSPTGNDANDGLSRGAPKLSIVRAIEAARANPAGSTLADFDCGGAEVVLVAGAHEWAGGAWGVGDWHTSGDWWLTITSEAGATLTAASTYPERYLTARGYAASGTCRLRFVGARWTTSGGGVMFVLGGVAAETWWDGLEAGSQFWDPGQHYSVRFAEDNAEIVTLDGAGTLVRRANCVRKRGCVTAFHGWTSLQDVVIENFIGVATQLVGAEERQGFLNLLFKSQRYTTGVAGWADVTGGANLSVTIPVAGQMRVDATAAMPMDFAAGFSELVGTSYWGCKCGSFPSSANNGTFEILATGTNGSGFPYVILDNPSAVVEVGTGAAYLVTAKISNQGRYVDEIHPDGLQVNTAALDNIYSHVRLEDCTNLYPFASNSNVLHRLVLNEWGDGTPGQAWNFAFRPETVTKEIHDCLFIHCSTPTQTDFTTGDGSTYTGTEAIECVFGSTSNWPAEAAAIDCHVVAGPTIGTGCTTGAWFDGDPENSPWSLLPSSGNLDSATGVVPYPAIWRWPSATGDTRGCSRMVGSGSWSETSGLELGTAAPAGVGTLSSALSLMMGLGSVPFPGSSSVSASLGLTANLGSAAASAAATLSASISALTNLGALSAAGTSSVSAELSQDYSLGAVGIYGKATIVAELRISVSLTQNPEPFMHQRIYNALKFLALNGPFYACTINSKTGQMTIDQTKPLTPVGVSVTNANSTFRPAEHWRRTLASERLEWNWIVRIEFPSIQVSFEAWEESLIDRDITIPDVEGLNSTRTLLARLVGAEYNPPPEASPNRGTVAEFAFQINPTSLRK